MTDYDALDWQRWAREVLTDFRVEHDDHTVALRLALVRLIHDLRAERDALRAALEHAVAHIHPWDDPVVCAALNKARATLAAQERKL